ncbi:MAG: sulfite exporter TauE/SafE family protein [Thermoleophilaceae bacterium]|nr:sulfite exporter TauE/SafE family protein [Thermoleophilaceae bacterium]
MLSRVARLALLGTAAGAFSGLFGVGGGTIIVPLLVVWFGYQPRAATGTSLVAIVVISLFGTVAHGALGNLHFAEGVLVGVPAVAGVVAGAAVQQRVSQRMLAGIFSLLLLASAVGLVVR